MDVGADSDVLVARLAHAVDAAGPHDLSLAVIIGEHRAAVAIAAKGLCRKETCAGDLSKLAEAVSAAQSGQ